jgi:hypothetical protein
VHIFTVFEVLGLFRCYRIYLLPWYSNVRIVRLFFYKYFSYDKKRKDILLKKIKNKVYNYIVKKNNHLRSLNGLAFDYFEGVWLILFWRRLVDIIILKAFGWLYIMFIISTDISTFWMNNMISIYHILCLNKTIKY